MAEISNPQVVVFGNERVRPLCDRMLGVYWQAKQTLAEYFAGDIGTLIDTAGAGEVLADGSAVDGRTRITGGDIYNVITALEQFVNYVEGAAVATSDRRTVFTKPHVN